MELSLNDLVERLDDLFFERETRAWRVASGVQRELPPVAELAELTRADAFQYVGELLGSPRLDDARRGRLTLLQRHLARAFIEAQAAPATLARDVFLGGHTFVAGARTWTPAEAKKELSRLSSREARDAVERELSLQLAGHADRAVQVLDRSLEASGALKLSPDALLELLHGRAPGPRLAQAEAMLAQSGAPALDLLGYALKKLEPTLTPKGARAHDAWRAASAPWLAESFRREDLSHALTRCLTDLGLNPSADGRLTVDTEPRAGRDANARCFELRVPDQVRLLLTPDSGLDAFGGWLRTWGVGLHRAHVGRALPFVERRLGDRAVVDAVGLLFEGFLREEGWLKRYLRLTAAQAKEAARLAAFRQLLELRRGAALASYSREVLAGGGAWARLDEAYVPRLSAALGVEVPAGSAPFEVDVFGDALRWLDAHALAQALHQHLRERFNEDFWRNPATGRWLVAFAASGQHDDAVHHAKACGSDGLDPVKAARRLIEVMGA